MVSNADELAALFNDLCDAAARETLPRFRTIKSVSNKLDKGFDPVTEADQAAERAIRAVIHERHPDHGIVGEEYGIERPEATLQWVIDPIDGTRAFISGVPLWGTLIGLYNDGIPIAGAMDQPFTGERFMALNGKSNLSIRQGIATRLKTSDVTKLGDATLMTTTPHILKSDADNGYWKLEERVKLFRYGADCYAYCLVAAGQIELVAESGLNAYDIAALIPIIEGAGGLVTNWQGGSAAQGGQVLAAANAEIHAAALEALNS